MNLKEIRIKGTKIVLANSYQRVVVGGQGSYVEFTLDDLVIDLKCKPGQEYRFTEAYSNCKYYWLMPEGFPWVKVYHQRGLVSYADYRIGRVYISPDHLDFEGQLYAEFNDQPGKGKEGLYP